VHQVHVQLVLPWTQAHQHRHQPHPLLLPHLCQLHLQLRLQQQLLLLLARC
jgi:hypothetical protein